MCIIFFNNMCVNNKTICDKKSTYMYVKMKKTKTTYTGTQHVKHA